MKRRCVSMFRSVRKGTVFLSIAMTYSNDNVKTLLVLNNDELTEKNFANRSFSFTA